MNTLAPIIALVRHVSSLPALWAQRVVARERLATLPERLLADIGLDHAAVAYELRKPFWRPFGADLGAGAPRFQPTASPSRAPVSMPAVLRPLARLSGATFPMLS
jgi:uncharacterized protein YjiS (DUF1127 family)